MGGQIAFLMMLSTLSVMAQDLDDFCLTSPNYSDFLQEIDIPKAQNKDGEDDIHIRLYVHVITDEKGENGRTEEDVLDAVANLNTTFNQYGIFLDLQDINFIPHNNYNNPDAITLNNTLSPIELFGPHAVCRGWGNDDGIDLFFGAKESSYINNEEEKNTSFGVSNGIPGNGIYAIGTWSSDHDFIMTNMLAHEVGHCMGLFHTFHGSNCEHLPGFTCPELVNQSGNNCDICGDYVCDTKASSKLENNINDNGDINDCTKVIFDSKPNPNEGFCFPDTQDPAGFDYQPDLDNIMAYLYPDCMDIFTAGQVIRMKDYVKNHPQLQLCTVDFGPGGGVLPQGLTEWKKNVNIGGTITIPDGATLHIMNTTIHMGTSEATFLVKPGGKLIIDNSIIREGNTIGGELGEIENWSCQNRWKGITVQGNYNIEQPTNIDLSNATTVASPDHGIVVLNHATIKNANIGVDCKSGLLFSENSTVFENNNTGVVLQSYHNFNVSDWQPRAHQSSIKNTTFKIGNDQVGIELFGVEIDKSNLDRIEFKGLTENSSGKGIRSVFSNFVLGTTEGGFDEQNIPNSFKDLKYGIHASGLPEAGHTLSIDGNLFDNIVKGITISGHKDCSIKNNRIRNIPKSIDPNDMSGMSDAYGIIMYESEMYEITNNELLTADALIDNTYGMVLINSGKLSSIVENNYFDGQYHAATQIEGEYSYVSDDNNDYDGFENISFNCNSYEGLSTYDWLIFKGKLIDQGFCGAFDETSFPSKNVWHDIAVNCDNTTTWNIVDNNPADVITEIGTFKLTPFNEAIYIPDCYDTDIEVVNCEYSSEDNCEPNGKTGTIIGNMDDEEIKAVMQQTNDPVYYYQLLSYLLRSRLDSADRTGYLGALKEQKTAFTNKRMLTHYISKGVLDSAKTMLKRIPLNNGADTAFYALYESILKEKRYNQTSSIRKTTEDTVRYIAASEYREAASHAQAYLALWYGEMQDRFASKIQSQSAAKRSNLVQEGEIVKIYPNPAKSEISIHLIEKSDIRIYDIQGKLMLSLSDIEKDIVVPTMGLIEGMYLVEIIDAKGQRDLHKLMIIK